MKYFTMEECILSNTAKRENINNTPSIEIAAHIVESVETLLDPLREAWERHCKQHRWNEVRIRISSGYRCPKLNDEVHGSSTSAHCYGYAFDLIPINGKMLEFSVSAARSLPTAPSTSSFPRRRMPTAYPGGCTWATSILTAYSSADSTSIQYKENLS